MTDRNKRRGTTKRKPNTRHRKVQLKSGKRGFRLFKNKRDMRVAHRWMALLVVLLAVVFLLAKCAKNVLNKPEITESTVEFSRKGALTVTSIEPFDKDYYSQDELQALVDEQVAEYNSNHDGKVACKDLKVEDQKAKLVMAYDSAEDYVNFNDQTMFFGSLEDAENAGYDLYLLSGRHNNKDESLTYDEGTAEKLKKNKVIVITEKLDVISARDILYYTDNFISDGLNKVTVSDDVSEDNPGILILE